MTTSPSSFSLERLTRLEVVVVGGEHHIGAQVGRASSSAGPTRGYGVVNPYYGRFEPK